MISQVSVRNFQSLKSVDIELGSFTVIVGDSASGKSALIRALRAVSSNIRGTSFVTSGQSAASVSLESQEWKVTLERNTANASYRVLDKISGVEREYTKLAGEVPPEVTKLLGIEPVVEGKSVNFAGEREQPYLLDDSGQQVAKVLGDLTHVSTLLEAIREANRQRSQANSTLRVHQEDLERLKERLEHFSGLPERAKRLAEAERLWESTSNLQTSFDTLKSLMVELQDLELAHSYVPKELPDIEQLETNFSRFKLLAQLVNELFKNKKGVSDCETDIAGVTDNINQLQRNYDSALLKLGECPTCRQRIQSTLSVR